MAGKWDDFEDEASAGEGSRLRADSDVTKEPSLPAAESPIQGWQNLVGTHRFNMLPAEDGADDARELAGVVRTLKTAMIALLGIGFGLLVGATFFASGSDAGEQFSRGGDKTSRTTSAPAPPSLTLTARPTRAYPSDSPVSSLEDARFGNANFEIDPKNVQIWRDQENLKQQVRPSLQQYFKTNTQNQKYVELVCDVIPNPHTKYEFPPKKYEEAKRWRPEEMLRHVRQYKWAIFDYYHMSQANSSERFYQIPPRARVGVITRLAKLFVEKLKSPNPSVKVVTMGTSVMSGHDNCRYYTYPSLLERNLQHLMAPFNAKVEVHNMGQNGDGPNMDNQLLCSPFTLGKFDFLHLWYPMMPHSDQIIKYNFLYRLLRDNDVQHIHQVEGDTKFLMQGLADAGFYTIASRLKGDIDWTPQHFWGRRNDGLCHNVTREGAVAVLAQNWHYGPIGFQILVDQATVLYADALEAALLSIIRKSGLPAVPRVSDIPIVLDAGECQQHANDNPHASSSLVEKYLCRPGAIESFKYACANGIKPKWDKGADIFEDVFLPSQVGNPFPPLSGANVVAWKYVKVKEMSKIHFATEAAESHYHERPECSDFVDEGYGFIAEKFAETDWLTFKVTLDVEQRLNGAKRVHFYICTGQRDNGFAELGNFTFILGVNGKPWGSGPVEYKSQCMRMNQPNGLENIVAGTVLGVRFVGWDSKRLVGRITIGQILLVAQQEGETSVPSMANRVPTPAPMVITPVPKIVTASPTSMGTEGEIDKPTVVPHPGDDDEGEPGVATVVPHPGDDDEDSSVATVVPHPGDDDVNAGRRRRRMAGKRRRHLVPHRAPVVATRT